MLDEQDITALREDLGGCKGAGIARNYRARGDAWLFEHPGQDANRGAHQAFLVLAGAASIGDVLGQSKDEPLLEICFQRQSAVGNRRARASPAAGATAENADHQPIDECVARPRQRATATRELLTATPDSVWPPTASLTRHGSLPDDYGYCYVQLKGALAGYDTEWKSLSATERLSLHGLEKIDPRVSVIEFTWSPLRLGKGVSSRFASRLELAWTFNASVPDSEIAEREASDDRVEPLTLIGDSRFAVPFLISAAIHREEQPAFNATGGGILFQFTSKLGPSKAWDGYLIAEPGFARYDNPLRRTTRWRGSIRAGLGLSLVFFEVGAERGYELDEHGAGDRDWRYFAGTRFRVPTSWALRAVGQ